MRIRRRLVMSVGTHLHIRVRIEHNDEVRCTVVRRVNIGRTSGVNGGACDGGGDRFAMIYRVRSLLLNRAGMRRKRDRAQSTSSNVGELHLRLGCKRTHCSFNPRACARNSARCRLRGIAKRHAVPRLAGDLGGAVETKFGTSADPRCAVIQNVEWPLHAHYIAQEITVRKEVAHGCVFVMDRCVGIKHKHHLGPRHLPCAPHA